MEDPQKIAITVLDEDDGHEGKVYGEPRTLVRTLIEEMYAKIIGRQPQPGDRLRCEGTGQDVFAFADQHLEAYVAAHCHSHEWLFAGQTGGA